MTTVTISEVVEMLATNEVLLAQVEAKSAQVNDAIAHYRNMVSQYGEGHPVTVQAHGFASELLDQSKSINKLARAMVTNAQQAARSLN